MFNCGCLVLGRIAFAGPAKGAIALEFVIDGEMNGLKEFQSRIVVGNIDPAEACQHRLPIDCRLTVKGFEAARRWGVIERVGGGEAGARVFILGDKSGAGQTEKGRQQQAGNLAGHAGTIPCPTGKSGEDFEDWWS